MHKRLDTSTIVTANGVVTSGSAIQLINALIRAKLNQLEAGRANKRRIRAGLTVYSNLVATSAVNANISRI
ncbi:hypothetical protein EOS_21490 [Caballeronia mineralivorans PML1(12)]|uniref:Uncharacterized protein n=1 Tax=Caballeronia mineralivorans PML1(12) TaxID=908627 RepID=A0A0J1CUB1_9BURK|nr:hypothetical protein EOS_21490 [Caballeronia mineralivorans PML1(12)]